MRTKCVKPQMWEDCWDLNTWGWGWRTLTNRACSCTGRCQSSALKWAARGQCGGCIGVRGFPWSKWTRDGAAWERGRSWEPEAVKPEDDTKKAVMVCRGPQLGLWVIPSTLPPWFLNLLPFFSLSYFITVIHIIPNEDYASVICSSKNLSEKIHIYL